MTRNQRAKATFILLAFSLLAACQADNQPAAYPPTAVLEISESSATPTTGIQEPVPSPPTAVKPTIEIPAEEVPTSAAELVIGIESRLPAELAAYISQLAADSGGRIAIKHPTAGEEAVEVEIEQGAGKPLVTWHYTLAAPFATIPDGMGTEELLAGWQSGTTRIGQLVLDTETMEILSEQWGTPSGSIWVVDPDELTSALWAGRPSWTILPIHKLTPELKVLRLDGNSPLGPDQDMTSWPLKASFGLSGNNADYELLQAAWDFPEANFSLEKLTQVAMSGVTALGRATAFQMELQGVTAPGRDVGPIMSTADIAHISHEVPFAPDCPYPNPIGDPIFCARDKYLELLTAIGTDVIELTGNHLNDWGTDSLLHTLDLYRNAGFELYGGGRDSASGVEPALFNLNGNKIAFVGCNLVGPPYAWAAVDRPGSQPCSFPAFYEQIRDLKADGYSVIATLQYYEFYHYSPTSEQREDFRAVAEAGADAVSGSQGHHAQGFDFHNGSFIHYGLGNLFFDQMDMLGTRQSFIDLYSFYDGRLINVDLKTSLIENYCCPRTMTEAERAELLESVFGASGW